MKQKIVSKSADQQQGASSQSKSRLLLDSNSFTVVVGAASDSCAIWTALFYNEFHEKPRSSRGSSSCSLSNRQIANLAFHSQFCLKFIQGCCSGYTMNTSIFHIQHPESRGNSINSDVLQRVLCSFGATQPDRQNWFLIFLHKCCWCLYNASTLL